MYSHNLNEVKVYFIIIQRFNAESSCENSFGPCAMNISRLTPILKKLTSPALLHFPGIFRIELIGKWINKRPLAQSWCTHGQSVLFKLPARVFQKRWRARVVVLFCTLSTTMMNLTTSSAAFPSSICTYFSGAQ